MRYRFEDLKVFSVWQIEPILLYSLCDVITFWILHSLKWIWWHSIGLLKAAGHSWNKGKTFQIGRGQFLHFRYFEQLVLCSDRQPRSFISISYSNWNAINLITDYCICWCDVGCIPQAKNKPDVQWGACKHLYTDPTSSTYTVRT